MRVLLLKAQTAVGLKRELDVSEKRRNFIRGQVGPGGGEGETTAHLAAQIEVDPDQIQAWKQTLLDGVAGAFSGYHDELQTAQEALIERLLPTHRPVPTTSGWSGFSWRRCAV